MTELFRFSLIIYDFKNLNIRLYFQSLDFNNTLNECDVIIITDNIN